MVYRQMSKLYELKIIPGTPEDLVADARKKFNLEIVSSKPGEPFYLALKGDLESVQNALKFIRENMEKRIERWEKNKK